MYREMFLDCDWLIPVQSQTLVRKLLSQCKNLLLQCKNMLFTVQKSVIICNVKICYLQCKNPLLQCKNLLFTDRGSGVVLITYLRYAVSCTYVCYTGK